MPVPVPETPATPATPSPERNFTVEWQSLKLDFDFSTQTVIGSTVIRIQPLSKDVRSLSFNCRECIPTQIAVDGKTVSNWKWDDPYRYLKPHATSTVHQHHQLQARLDTLETRTDGELAIPLPRSIRIREIDQFGGSSLPSGTGDSGDVGDGAAAAGRYSSIAVQIDFRVDPGSRDGFHWVGCDGSTTQWPHVYTRNSRLTKSASCMFPCVDDPGSRHPWNILIGCPRTLGDAFGSRNSSEPSAGTEGKPEPTSSQLEDNTAARTSSLSLPTSNKLGLNSQEMELNMTVACSGDLSDIAIESPSRQTVSFLVSSSVSAAQIGLAVGPFEDIDLSDLREVDEDERLGEQAVRVRAYCLPGRSAEVRNACMPLAKAVDFFTTTFTTFTGESWKLCFVDDLVNDTLDTAGLSICSTRLLFPEDIIDPLFPVTRKLVLALAAQYAGINVVPREPTDSWVVAGIASFMADIFMKHLSGNNEYRFRQKRTADRVAELDINRPSIRELGGILHIDPSEEEFMTLKSGVVLFLLDRKLTKSSGSAGVSRIIGRILNNAKAEELESSMLSTAQFARLCVKMGHVDLDTFFNQWVYGAGCPSFEVRQTFNKKRLSVTMTVSQVQADNAEAQSDLDPKTFLRDAKEDIQQVEAGALQSVFTGPMTVRIHEADGTPTEHIIEISRVHQTFEIPYNNKYKRKKSKRQKARLAAAAGANADGADGQDDVLLYCLGDVLQSEEEAASWRLTDWTKEMEEKMSEESYEWIRMDADFEWICKLYVHMPAYMWVSQLQQDRDVVAQLESLQWFSLEIQKRAHPLTSTFLIRTLMDKRYFYGIRTLAASMLAGCAKAEVDWIGLYQLQKAYQELYCVEDSDVTKPNDFSDRTSYIVQCAILKALSEVKDTAGRTPPAVKRYFLDRLRFNDNSNNEFSDAYYVSLLLQCITKSLLGPSIEGDDDAEIEAHTIQREAIAQIDRYRRMDEWTSSFQNIFTTTTLDCLLQLAKGKVIQPKLTEFLHYTRPGNSIQVRIQAFDCLVELGMLRNASLMKYLLHELAYDTSPHVRENLNRIFGKGLGMIAIGTKDGQSDLPMSSGLVIEQGGVSATEAKQAEVSRRQTTGGALEALKAELSNNETFKEALWHAVSSTKISTHELSGLLEICSFIFEATNSFLLQLRMPRYWKVKHLGGAKLAFSHTSKVRWQPRQPQAEPATPKAPTPKPATPKAAVPPPLPRRESSPGVPLKIAFEKNIGLKRKESSSHINGGGPAKKSRTESVRSPSAAVPAVPAASPPASAEAKRSNIIKLKIGPRGMNIQPRTQSSLSQTASSPISVNPATNQTPSHLGYAPVNGVSSPAAAPFGFGKITGPSAPISVQNSQTSATEAPAQPPQMPSSSTAWPQGSSPGAQSELQTPRDDSTVLPVAPGALEPVVSGGDGPQATDQAMSPISSVVIQDSKIETGKSELSQSESQTGASAPSNQASSTTDSSFTQPSVSAGQSQLEGQAISTPLDAPPSKALVQPEISNNTVDGGLAGSSPKDNGSTNAPDASQLSSDVHATQKQESGNSDQVPSQASAQSPTQTTAKRPLIKLRLNSISGPKPGRS